MNFFDDTLTVNQHYALAAAQDFFVISHYMRALSVNNGAKMQDSRVALAELQALHPSPVELFLQLLQNTKPFDLFESLTLAQTIPTPQLKMMLLFLSFQQMSSFGSSKGKPVFDTTNAKLLKSENPEASVLELVHLAVQKFDCELELAPGYEMRDQFLSVMGPYITLVSGPKSPPHPVAYTLFQGHPKYSFFDATKAMPVIQYQFVRHATLSNAYEILFPATIPNTVKVKKEILTFSADKDAPEWVASSSL